MRGKITMVFVMAVMLLNFSCEKEIDKALEQVVDCTGESFFVKMKNKTDDVNIKKVDFSIEYSGTKTLKSVTWDFGDGTPKQTVPGTATAVSHIYSAAGNYTVRYDVTIENGGSSCTTSPTRSITVN